MKTKSLCLLLSLLLLFPFLPSLADTTPCEHYPGQVVYDDLRVVTRVEPQIGVDGWEELACPECGQVVETYVLTALVPETRHPATSNDEIVSDSVPRSEPEPADDPAPVADIKPAADPVPAAAPEEPAQQEAPVKEEAAAEPAAKSEAPGKAEAEAVSASEPEVPAKAEEPPKTEAAAKAEVSAQSENPLPQAGGTGTAAADANGAAQQAAKADPPKAQDVTANVAPQQTGGTAGGGGTTGSAGRKATNTARVNAVGGEEAPAEENQNTRTFPYRRVKMKPRPGIRAEAAGILLWPAFGTPFQSLYND